VPSTARFYGGKEVQVHPTPRLTFSLQSKIQSHIGSVAQPVDLHSIRQLYCLIPVSHSINNKQTNNTIMLRIKSLVSIVALLLLAASRIHAQKVLDSTSITTMEESGPMHRRLFSFWSLLFLASKF
jgi:hypothetical protein